MQLTLIPAGHPTMGASAAPSRRVASPSRDQALSQLDRIAAANARAPGHGLGGVATWLGLLGGCVVLAAASMWQDGTGSPGVTARIEAPAPIVAATPAATARLAAAPGATPEAPATAIAAMTAPAVATLPADATDAPLPPLPADADDTARKARIAALAEARRKAALLAAQERAQAEEAQRVQQAQQQQQRDDALRAEQAAEAARQRAAAAERVRLAALNVAEPTRLNVRALCNGAGGFLAQQFCQARECGRAEFQGDAVCMRLRETDAERLRASAER